MPGMPGVECRASVTRVSFPFSETVDIVDCVAALPMTPGWHAERAPDGLAIVMGGTGETVSYAQLDGFEGYDSVLAVADGGPLDNEHEGREMLYSSGTTGRP